MNDELETTTEGLGTSSIGIFDSGIGGLSVLRHIQQYLPTQNLIYVADQAHVPYGPRSHEQITDFSQGITQFFLTQGVNLVVVACNRASAGALTPLRRMFPQVPFVGMEPAVKPAARQTKTGKVGVLATEGTFDSTRYAELMARFAGDVTVWEDPCIGLVNLIEAGQLDTPQTEQFLRHVLQPMLAQGIDTLVLGCTHYPFVLPLIKRIVGDTVTIIDPAPAVARQTQRLWQQQTFLAASAQRGTVRLITTGDKTAFAQLTDRVVGEIGRVETAVWQTDTLYLHSCEQRVR